MIRATNQKKQAHRYHGILEAGLAQLAPRPQVSLASWLEEYAYTPERMPWDSRLYPYANLPGGPSECYDDPFVTDIWLQWSTRLGKTLWSLLTLCYSADVHPCPMFYVQPTQNATQIKVQQLYAMLEECPRTRPLLLPEALRRRSSIRLKTCTIFAGWGGSPISLADKEVARGVASEIDKWEVSAARMRGESDPLKLFDQRFVNRYWKKRVKESTPTVENESRVEVGFLGADQRRLWVPCPHCGTYQILNFRPVDGIGGLVFDRGEQPKYEVEMARLTARYLCACCAKPIADRERPTAIRSGVWCPDGCHVDNTGTVIGTSLYTGPERSFHLSSLYALVLTWGDIAAEFVKTMKRPRELQNFVNSWLAETWKTTKREIDELEMVSRLTTQEPMGRVPDWATFLTAGVDMQATHYVYQVWAWGPASRGHLVRFGTVETESELEDVLLLDYEQPATGRQLRVRVCFFDSGFKPDEVHKFCDRVSTRELKVLPCKGLSGMPDQSWRITKIERGLRAGARIAHVNTNYWQAVVQAVLEYRKPHEPGGMSFCEEVRGDTEFWSQLLNEQLTIVRLPTGSDSVRWTLIDEARPNDQRDAWRYARAASEAFVKGAWNRVVSPPVVCPDKIFSPSDQDTETTEDAIDRIEKADAEIENQRPQSASLKPKAKRPASRWINRKGGWLFR